MKLEQRPLRFAALSVPLNTLDQSSPLLIKCQNQSSEMNSLLPCSHTYARTHAHTHAHTHTHTRAHTHIHTHTHTHTHRYDTHTGMTHTQA